MVTSNQKQVFVVAMDQLHEQFPTHLHDVSFWEALGRTIATFGFLEKVLGRAIFAFTATNTYPEHEIQKAYDEWLPILQKAASETLKPLIDLYENSVNESGELPPKFDQLLKELREASAIRNVLCHSSWEKSDTDGKSLPIFIRKKDMLKFDTLVDVAWLSQTRSTVVRIACEVVNSVTAKGFQFPGTNGPGQQIW
jgi:hypothetical protein